MREVRIVIVELRLTRAAAVVRFEEVRVVVRSPRLVFPVAVGPDPATTIEEDDLARDAALGEPVQRVRQAMEVVVVPARQVELRGVLRAHAPRPDGAGGRAGWLVGSVIGDQIPDPRVVDVKARRRESVDVRVGPVGSFLGGDRPGADEEDWLPRAVLEVVRVRGVEPQRSGVGPADSVLTARDGGTIGGIDRARLAAVARRGADGGASAVSGVDASTSGPSVIAGFAAGVTGTAVDRARTGGRDARYTSALPLADRTVAARSGADSVLTARDGGAVGGVDRAGVVAGGGWGAVGGAGTAPAAPAASAASAAPATPTAGSARLVVGP
jgi:hypothetical protein